MNILTQLTETVARPGVLGLVGMAAERQLLRDLQTYFDELGKKIVKADFGKLAKSTVALGRHAVNMSMQNILRTTSHELLQVLSTNLYAAQMKADKQHPFAEADNPTFTDQVGLSGQAAADWAAKHAAAAVTQINDTTRQIIADAVASGIEDQLGVDGISGLIRRLTDEFSGARARMIASTETNAAMSAATLEKLDRLNIEYKQIILSADACPICESIYLAGPVPLDEPFVDDDGEEYDSTPIHPNCRCATTGARAPEGVAA